MTGDAGSVEIPRLPSSKTRWFAIGAIAVASIAFLAIATSGIGKNLVYYWGPTELKAAGSSAQGATIRLGGLVVAGSIKYDATAGNLDFEVRDTKEQVRVHSSGVPPQMFRENIGVVVEGTARADGVFESNRLMVSHDNQYRAPKTGATPSAAEMMTTTAGMEAEKKP